MNIGNDKTANATPENICANSNHTADDAKNPLAEAGNELITEAWLAQAGFKWHQFDRQPTKQWLLWLGWALNDGHNFMRSDDDLGIEVAEGRYDGAPAWHCWLRSDLAHKYGRFIHIRYLRTVRELIQLIEALTARPWLPENNLYGAMRTPEQAARVRDDNERLDRRLLLKGHKWQASEEDDTRGGALPEHLDLQSN